MLCKPFLSLVPHFAAYSLICSVLFSHVLNGDLYAAFYLLYWNIFVLNEFYLWRSFTDNFVK
uniref:Uncharacterized protein n=1 Tax=Rhizophora mucronata TaxID=61149 RepID=A0A2P2QDG0_RHIMU